MSKEQDTAPKDAPSDDVDPPPAESSGVTDADNEVYEVTDEELPLSKRLKSGSSNDTSVQSTEKTKNVNAGNQVKRKIAGGSDSSKNSGTVSNTGGVFIPLPSGTFVGKVDESVINKDGGSSHNIQVSKQDKTSGEAIT